jgi:hypothetical protein
MAAKHSAFMLIINAYFSYGSQCLILYCVGKTTTPENLLFLFYKWVGYIVYFIHKFIPSELHNWHVDWGYVRGGRCTSILCILYTHRHGCLLHKHDMNIHILSCPFSMKRTKHSSLWMNTSSRFCPNPRMHNLWRVPPSPRFTATILGPTRGYHILLNTILINMQHYQEKLLGTSHLLLSSTYWRFFDCHILDNIFVFRLK